MSVGDTALLGIVLAGQGLAITLVLFAIVMRLRQIRDEIRKTRNFMVSDR